MANPKSINGKVNSKAKKVVTRKAKNSNPKSKDNSFFDSIVDSITEIFQPHSHHEEAAKHATKMAYHHTEAHKAHIAGNHEKAAVHAQLASGHMAHTKSHSIQADKKRVDSQETQTAAANKNVSTKAKPLTKYANSRISASAKKRTASKSKK